MQRPFHKVLTLTAFEPNKQPLPTELKHY